MFEASRTSRKMLNLTPLIDIIFLLIVFFMLTSRFALTEALELNLASISNSVPAKHKEEAIMLYLKLGGGFTLNNTSYKEEKLKEALWPLLQKDNRKTVVIVTSPAIPVQQMVSAMDKVKEAGGRNISLAEETAP